MSKHYYHYYYYTIECVRTRCQVNGKCEDQRLQEPNEVFLSDFTEYFDQVCLFVC